VTSHTPRTIRDQLTTLTHRTMTLRARLNPTLEHLAGQLTLFDGYPTTASGADSQPGGQRTIAVKHWDHGTEAIDHVPVTSVEDAAIRRIDKTGDFTNGPQAALDELADYLTTANKALDVLIRECERHTPGLTASDIDRLRCIGTGEPDGATCTQIHTPRRVNDITVDDGRCIRCGPIWDKRETERKRESDERRARRHKNKNAA
jgi:hypothetical protein